MNKRKDALLLLALAGHCFFALGVVLLVIFARLKSYPIHLDELEIIKILLCFFVGYLFVFFEWLVLTKTEERYSGKADDVPAYLTNKLYGMHPYLFTFGKKNSSNGNSDYKWHKYTDADVTNKKLAKVFCVHFNKNNSLIFALIAILLPFLIFDQALVSFVRIVQANIFLYIPYMYLISMTWLSILGLLVFRLYLFLFADI